jgi:hypothetical protein
MRIGSRLADTVLAGGASLARALAAGALVREVKARRVRGGGACEG